MVDIFLELPDRVIADYELKAALSGKTAEDLMREVIKALGAQDGHESRSDLGPVEDEPIVKAAEIELEGRRLGYQLGWRFITCPQAQMENSKLLLVGLNPAGREIHGPFWSQELGSAYRVEEWDRHVAGQAPLQQQIQQLFTFLGLADDEVFNAQFVPFRSPNWEALDRRDEAEAYARRLWTWLLPKVSFDRVVCVGKEKPGKPLAALLNASFEASLPVGWGSVTADRYRLPDGRPLIALPHLSRFRVFGRDASRAALSTIFEL